MSHHNIITYEQYLSYKKEAPEYLTTLYINVYDIEGISSKVRAYKLPHMLEDGFFKSLEEATTAREARDAWKPRTSDATYDSPPMVRSFRA